MGHDTSFELLLPLGALAFYVYDCGILLYDNELLLLNAGHRRHSTAGRCVVVGKTVKTEELPAYCAVALAGLGDLPDTIMSRSIRVFALDTF